MAVFYTGTYKFSPIKARSKYGVVSVCCGEIGSIKFTVEFRFVGAQLRIEFRNHGVNFIVGYPICCDNLLFTFGKRSRRQVGTDEFRFENISPQLNSLHL